MPKRAFFLHSSVRSLRFFVGLTFLRKEGSFLAIILIFTCILSWSIASLYVLKADLPLKSFVSAGYQSVIATIVLLTGVYFITNNNAKVLK